MIETRFPKLLLIWIFLFSLFFKNCFTVEPIDDSERELKAKLLEGTKFYSLKELNGLVTEIYELAGDNIPNYDDTDVTQARDVYIDVLLLHARVRLNFGKNLPTICIPHSSTTKKSWQFLIDW